MYGSYRDNAKDWAAGKDMKEDSFSFYICFVFDLEEVCRITFLSPAEQPVSEIADTDAPLPHPGMFTADYSSVIKINQRMRFPYLRIDTSLVYELERSCFIM